MMLKTKRSFVTLVLTAILLLAATSLQAAPFLVCDPYPASAGVTSFTLFWDGSTTGVSAPVFTDATGTYLKYDLAGVTNGTHTVKVRAKNSYGESGDSAPFTFDKQLPPAPTNIRITAN